MKKMIAALFLLPMFSSYGMTDEIWYYYEMEEKEFQESMKDSRKVKSLTSSCVNKDQEKQLVAKLESQSLEALEEYLKECPDVNDLHMEVEFKIYPVKLLDIACKGKRPDLIQKLINRGASIDPQHGKLCKKLLDKAQKTFADRKKNNANEISDLTDIQKKINAYQECLNLFDQKEKERVGRILDHFYNVECM